jgi:ferredoxin-type protein NapH
MPDAAIDPRRAGLPASAVITAIVAAFVFSILMPMAETQAARLAAVLGAAWYCFLLFMMLRSGKPGHWRRIFLASIALFFFPEFIADVVDLRGHMTVDPITVVTASVPYCHIVNAMTLIPMALTKTLIFPAEAGVAYSMLAAWLLACLILGRGWCSWVCFYGGWDDMFSRARGKALVSLKGREESVRRFSKAMLAFVALASMATLTAVYCAWLCPFKAVTEYEALHSIGAYLAAILFVSLFVGLVIVLPALTRKRFQCSAFCPLGPVNAAVDRISPFGIRIDTESCSRCGKCIEACPMLALDESIIKDGKGRPTHGCSKCGECVQACPRKAIRFVFRPSSWIRAAFKLDGPRAGGGSKSALSRLGHELLEPRLVFTVTGFLLGSFMSISSVMATLSRVINWIAIGQFTRGY